MTTIVIMRNAAMVSTRMWQPIDRYLGVRIALGSHYRQPLLFNLLSARFVISVSLSICYFAFDHEDIQNKKLDDNTISI